MGLHARLSQKAAEVGKATLHMASVQGVQNDIKAMLTDSEDSAFDGLTKQAKKLDDMMLKSIISIIDESGSGVADNKIKLFSQEFFGKSMSDIQAMRDSLDAVLESGSLCVQFMMAKALSQNPKYTIGAFKVMLQETVAYKLGQATASAPASAMASADGDTDMDALAGRLAGV